VLPNVLLMNGLTAGSDVDYGQDRERIGRWLVKERAAQEISPRGYLPPRHRPPRRAGGHPVTFGD